MKILKVIFSKDSEMFLMASKSKFLPNIVISILLFFGLWMTGRLLAIAILSFPLSYLSNGNLIISALARTIRLAFIGVAIISAFIIWVRYIEKRPIRTMGFVPNGVARKYLIGFVIGISFMIANTLAFLALGVVRFEGFSFEQQGVSVIVSVFIMLFGYIIQSASEEIAVRGWLLPVIGSRYNVITGVLVTSIMFGAIHLFNPNVTVLSFVNIVIAGIFIALIVILQGDIWGVCGYHCGWNWALANVFGYQISGYYPIGGSLIRLRVEGSELLSGGFFGPEAGVVATVFLSVGIIVMSIMIYKKRTIKTDNSNLD